MSKRPKNKRQQPLNRASPIFMPTNGGLMYVPAQQQQGVLGQTFYGSKAGIPTGQSALFSPGEPLPTQPGVNPGGYPVQFKFPVGYNWYPPDRSLGDSEIPSFQQLRSLAKLCSGVTLCERVWLDLVPRMQLKISLKKEYKDRGADEKDYQKEISFFRSFFEKPDGKRDMHTWIRVALKEQTQIDELYIYKNRTRGGKLLGLKLLDGSTMKPLLDDWGDIPEYTPNGEMYAYQQYPWGLPGMKYTTSMMIHYNESPSSFTPYGFSRIEGVIFLINQVIRKQKKDLSNFTEGNIPQGMMLVPPDATWTPDQIDAFEQAWNALLAGNTSQQVRMRFTQPGMTYQPFEQYELKTEFDQFILNYVAAMYGVSMQDLAFTDDIHKSNGDSQQNVLYRRTIDPLAITYAGFLTECMNNDFEPSLHGEMFEASFSGYEEDEDLQSQVAAYSEAIQNAFISPANAAKKMSFPEIPETGPLFVTKGGIVPLASFEIGSEARKAQDAAQLAGLQMAANPQQSQEQGDDEEEDEPAESETKNAPKKSTKPKQQQPTEEKRYTVSELLQLLSQQTETQTPDQANGTHFERSTQDTVAAGTERATHQIVPTPDASSQSDGNHEREISQEYRKWRTRAIDDVKAARTLRGFTTTLIPEGVHKWISDELVECSTPDQVREVFNRARDTSRQLDNASEDYRRWCKQAVDNVREYKKPGVFMSNVIPDYVQAYILFELDNCNTADEVQALFKRVQDQQYSLGLERV